ncbi:flavin monoamine oxidase family protein [Alkalihalobacillus sp. AL-G]|uniref:flavin monoamine oxidase family protein n=1 Tax=Alkalihalobacillus sp. AL-G TaxID=2926399 RepID=UPI00272AF456|nr:flavin monoamine oxidase family protein [Alkalihalobacillus sp. AL-G]WLD94553.1 flavin monoamine oxidase family protein [Alkalihalobacillus sp. AL-G]
MVQKRPDTNVLSYPDDMLSILQKGLDPSPEPKKVVILGAGMSGLVAGALLKTAGHHVTILEGNTRLGGRVYTIRKPFSAGNHLDAGAMRIPSKHKLTFSLINQFKLPVRPFINSTKFDLIYVNGVKTRRYIYEKNPDILQFPLPPDERGKTAFELLKEAVQPFLDLYEKATDEEKEELKKQFDKYSFGMFLRYNPIGRSLSPVAINMISVMLGIEGFPELSFIDILTDVVATLFEEDLAFYEIIGGNDRLPWSFLPYLQDNIQFGKRVVQINKFEDELTVTAIDQVTGGSHRYTADRIITSIPFPVFQFVDVKPYDTFSYKKWNAIRSLTLVPSVKIGIEFTDRFWFQEHLYGGNFTTDQPTQTAYYPSTGIGQPGPGSILAAYTWGDNADLWSSQPKHIQLQEALKFLAIVHGPKVYEKYRSGTAYSWVLNQFAGGCFTLFKPDQYSDLFDVIRKPESQIHFAGEHTSSFHGWIEGAVESGIRVAYEVNKSRNGVS